MLKTTFLILFSLLTYTVVFSQPPSTEVKKGDITLRFLIDEKGSPRYAVWIDGVPVIHPSLLGFTIDTEPNFFNGFRVVSYERRNVSESWKPVWGEVSTIHNEYEELLVRLRHRSGKLLNVKFRVFHDGIGFRYEFPRQDGLKYFIIKDELTQFRLDGDHETFWIPGDYDSNEYTYTRTPLSQINNRAVVSAATDIAVRTVKDEYAVQTPLLMKSGKGLYINIHEAAQLNYPAMQLHANSADLSFQSSLVPDAFGNKAYLHAPAVTPWRTILITHKATELLESKTILNLNEPSTIKNTGWIRPMKFVGVWWEMQTGKGGWNYSSFVDSTDSKGQLIPNNTHSANTKNVKRYIDFAAKNKLDAVLVEGWNKGWEDWFGNWKEEVFDFVTPYPDFNMKEISAYAKSKGVKMIMHNETSGSATNYERYIDTAFKVMNRFGYPAVKTGYVGRIIPRGEAHDGQWMMRHYERVLQKGIQYKVTIDAHEMPRPTGLHRTYPNFMASEAARGNEFNAFSTGSPPDHETILPFTRLMGGPMDYTPGIFKLKGYAAGFPDRGLHSTLAKQLALYVTMYSPLQMAADLPENYDVYPDAFRFIRDVPVDWDDTRILEAEPGDYITIARKQKGAENWFIGAITDENQRSTSIKFTFLDKDKKYRARIYTDAADAHWNTNPEAHKIEEMIIDYKSELKLTLAPGGGAAISVMALKQEGK